MSDLLSVVLLYLIESQKGVLAAELILQRIKEDLVLVQLGLSFLKRLVDSHVPIDLHLIALLQQRIHFLVLLR